MKKKESPVYKGLEKAGHEYVDKETLKASEILYRRLAEIVKPERDITFTSYRSVKRRFGRYSNVYEYGDGTVVKKVLLSDSTAKGKGYHSVTIVACAARLKADVGAAVEKATKVRTKAETVGERITKETVVVLSKQLPFIEAQKSRRIGHTAIRSVQVFSVQNALGVTKVVLKKLANLFNIRSQKILGNRKVWGELKEFGIMLAERAKKLLKSVQQLDQAMTEGGYRVKKAERRQRASTWAFVQQARAWGVRFYTYATDLTDPHRVQDIIRSAAKRQGINLWALETRKWRVEAGAILNASC